MIEYLDKYPLQSQKYLQYFIFRRTIRLIDRKEHLTIKGLNKIKLWKVTISNIYN